MNSQEIEELLGRIRMDPYVRREIINMSNECMPQLHERWRVIDQEVKQGLCKIGLEVANKAIEAFILAFIIAANSPELCKRINERCLLPKEK